MCNQQRLRPACAYAQSDHSHCYPLEYSMIVKLLTEQHLGFLSLKRGCTGSFESTLVKMPHCWKSHVVAHFIFYISTGMKTVNQRCRFVTSTYRDMLLAAVDFRNRFAERPYLSEELLEPDQGVVIALNLFQLVAGIFLGQIWGQLSAPYQFKISKNFPKWCMLAVYFGKNFIKI